MIRRGLPVVIHVRGARDFMIMMVESCCHRPGFDSGSLMPYRHKGEAPADQHRQGLPVRGIGYQVVGGGHPADGRRKAMLVIGLILLLLGFLLKVSILYTIGIILLVIGAVLWILGAVGRPVGGRKVWF
jgi:hypothetical protein